MVNLGKAFSIWTYERTKRCLTDENFALYLLSLLPKDGPPEFKNGSNLKKTNSRDSSPAVSKPQSILCDERKPVQSNQPQNEVIFNTNSSNAKVDNREKSPAKRTAAESSLTPDDESITSVAFRTFQTSENEVTIPETLPVSESKCSASYSKTIRRKKLREAAWKYAQRNPAVIRAVLTRYQHAHPKNHWVRSFCSKHLVDDHPTSKCPSLTMNLELKESPISASDLLQPSVPPVPKKISVKRPAKYTDAIRRKQHKDATRTHYGQRKCNRAQKSKPNPQNGSSVLPTNKPDRMVFRKMQRLSQKQPVQKRFMINLGKAFSLWNYERTKRCQTNESFALYLLSLLPKDEPPQFKNGSNLKTYSRANLHLQRSSRIPWTNVVSTPAVSEPQSSQQESVCVEKSSRPQNAVAQQDSIAVSKQSLPGFQVTSLTLPPNVIFDMKFSNTEVANSESHTDLCAKSTFAQPALTLGDELKTGIVSEPFQPCENEVIVPEPVLVSESITTRIKTEPNSCEYENLNTTVNTEETISELHKDVSEGCDSVDTTMNKEENKSEVGKARSRVIGKMWKDGGVCSMVHCSNRTIQRNARSFHRFPRDKALCADWVDKCKRTDLDIVLNEKGALKLNYSHHVCSDHFKLSDYRNPNLKSQGLKPGTVPTVNLPGVNTCNSKDRRFPKKFNLQFSPASKRFQVHLNNTD